jgi:FixJ family two-component response regulator
MPVVHVIDDDDFVRLMLDCLFRSLRFEVRAYSSTHEFLKADSFASPGCIALDIRRPGRHHPRLCGSLSPLGFVD